MIKLKRIINEIMEDVSSTPPPAHVIQATNNQFSTDFVNYIKTVENSIKKGYDKKTNLWYPYQDRAGWHIGYGHKIVDTNELLKVKQGVSPENIDTLLKTDLTVAEKNVNDYIKKTYKITLGLSDKQKEMLTDFAFNLGGLEKFPKFTDAVVRNQTDIIKKEYLRKSMGKDLTGRNQAFYNRFLK